MVWETGALAAYIATVLAIVLSPGPDTVIILRHGMAGGARAGFAAVLGVQVGLVAHTAAAAVGLSLLVASSPALFKTITVAGAVYLGWLGIQGLRSSLLGLASLETPGRSGPIAALRDALLTNLLNPKVIVLYLALIPNFVRLDGGRIWPQLGVLSVILIAINAAWQSVLVLAADRIRRWLDRPRVRRGVSWSTGLVLLGFAAGLLLDHVL